MRNLLIHPKSKSLFILFFLVLSLSEVIAQAPIEIVIVGSSHTNDKGNYRPIINKLKRFQPDMVFGEYLSSEDLKARGDSSSDKKTFAPRYNYIKRRNPATARLDKKISDTQKALAHFPYYHQTRMELASHYVLNYDRGNAEYQFFVLENYMKDKMGKKELEVYRKKFGSTDSLRKLKLLRESTEYHNIFFPLMYELNHGQIYPMDCQRYDESWTLAWNAAGAQIKIMQQKAKADSTSLESQTVRSIKQFYQDLELVAQTENLREPYTLMNSAVYAKYDAAQNFYGGEEFYGYPGFPTEAIKAMIVQWNLRNQAMCENIVRQAKAKGAKRVVVGVGASHRKWMEEIFSRMPDVKLINFNSLP